MTTLLHATRSVFPAPSPDPWVESDARAGERDVVATSTRERDLVPSQA